MPNTVNISYTLLLHRQQGEVLGSYKNYKHGLSWNGLLLSSWLDGYYDSHSCKEYPEIEMMEEQYWVLMANPVEIAGCRIQALSKALNLQFLSRVLPISLN